MVQKLDKARDALGEDLGHLLQIEASSENDEIDNWREQAERQILSHNPKDEGPAFFMINTVPDIVNPAE